MNAGQVLTDIDAIISGHVTTDRTVSGDAMRSAPQPIAATNIATDSADAIADSLLIPLDRAVTGEARIRYPVLLTSSAWEDCVAWDASDNDRKGTVQDIDGRLWDVVWMLRCAINRHPNDDPLDYQLYRVPRPGRARKPRLVSLHAVVTADDAGLPCIVVSKPGED